MQDLKETTLRAGVTRLIAQATNFVLRIASLMVLARLLDPEDFGLVGMVTVVTGVLSLFKDAGLSTVTIQRSAISHDQISTLFWVNILVGLALGLATVAAAPLLTSFYLEPRLFWITIVLAAGFLINGFGVQHWALLQRDMRFMALSLIEIGAQVLGSGVAIGMALAGLGYWALVGMTLVVQFSYTAGFWLAHDWMPGLPHHGKESGSMIRFGGMATLNAFVCYVAFNIEKVLVGRLWGAEALGVYGRAYQLVSIPTENLNSAIGGVALSALSRLQDNPTRFKTYFLKGYSLLTSLTFPIAFGCALFAEDIVMLLLGPKWVGAIQIFRLLTPTILAFALLNPFSSFLMSLGLFGRSVKMAFAIAPVMIIAYVIGLPYGPAGVAIAYSAAMVVAVIPLLAACIFGTMITAKDFVPVVGRPLISVVVGATVAYATQTFYGQFHSPLVRLMIGSSVLFIAYLWMLLFIFDQKRFYFDLIRALWPGSIGREAESA